MPKPIKKLEKTTLEGIVVSRKRTALTMNMNAQTDEIILLMRRKDFSLQYLSGQSFLATLNVKGCLMAMEKAAIKNKARYPAKPQC